MGDAFLRLKLRDQEKSIQILSNDASLSQLRHLKVCRQQLIHIIDPQLHALHLLQSLSLLFHWLALP